MESDGSIEGSDAFIASDTVSNINSFHLDFFRMSLFVFYIFCLIYWYYTHVICIFCLLFNVYVCIHWVHNQLTGYSFLSRILFCNFMWGMDMMIFHIMSSIFPMLFDFAFLSNSRSLSNILSVSRFIILRRICNMQEKLFIQQGRFSFFFRPNLPTFFIQKHMTAVGLGQQGSQAVGSGFESLPCQYFLRFFPNIFDTRKY